MEVGAGVGARLVFAWRCPARGGVAISALPSSEKFWFECCCSICSCQSTADRAHSSPGLGMSELNAGVSFAPRMLAELQVMK